MSLSRGLAVAVLVVLLPACGAQDDSESADACTADLEQAIGPGAEVREPTWSPDGSRIAFSAVETEKSGIYAVTVADCTIERLVPRGELIVGAPDWSSTNVLAFDAMALGATTEEGIYTMPADGGTVRRVTDGPDLFPTWSPDGTQIAFARGGYAEITDDDPTPEYANRNVWVVRADGSNARQVTDGPWHGTAGWTSDGERLVTDTDPGVIEIGTDGSGRRVLFDSEHDDPSWSPDGKFLLLGGVDGLALAEGGRHPIEPLDARSAFSSEWSPDGRWIAFTDGEGAADLWLVRPNGTGLRQLTTTA